MRATEAVGYVLGFMIGMLSALGIIAGLPIVVVAACVVLTTVIFIGCVMLAHMKE